MIPYAIHVAVLLTGCVVFYKALLQKETFYRLNRSILLASLVVSFALPFLRVPEQWSFRTAEEVSPPPALYPIVEDKKLPQPISSPAEINDLQNESIVRQKAILWLVRLYWFGVAVFALNFLVQIVVLLYRAYSRPVILDGPFRIVELSGNKAPCSFGNSIFINPEKYDWETYEQIMQHEKIHIMQLHSLDILIAEIVIIFQWFNPFAWMFRRDIENNLEFLTDQQLLGNSKVDKKKYQLSLLQVSAPHFPLSVTTNYNQSLLKRRLLMMNAKRSNIHTAWKYFFLAPMLLGLVSVTNEPLDSTTAASGKYVQAPALMQLSQPDQDTIIVDKTKTGNTIKNSTSGTDNTGSFTQSELQYLKKQNVPSEYAASFIPLGYKHMGVSELAALHSAGVTPQYIKSFQDIGYSDIDPQDAFNLKTKEVPLSYAKSFAELGYNDAGDVVILYTAGVTTQFVKSFKDLGYANIDAKDVFNLKIQKVPLSYAKNMINLGEEYHDAGDASILYSSGTTPEYIKGFQAIGYTDIDAKDAVALNAAGVTPQLVKDYGKLVEKPSLRDIAAAKSMGATPEYIATVKNNGHDLKSLKKYVAWKSSNTD